MKERLKYIDIAKGIAIICVVIGHVLVYDIYGFTYVMEFSPLIKFICIFHMPLFIFLSGLVTLPLNSYKEISKDIIKRFRVLIIPFLTIGSIYSITTHHDLSFFNNEMKYGYWYLLILFYCYLFNYILILIYRKKSISFFLLQSITAVFFWKLVCIISLYMSNDIKHFLSINQWCIYFPYFFCGFIIRHYNLHIYIFKNSILFFTAIIIWSLSDKINFPYGNYLISIAAIFVIIYVCCKIEENQVKYHNILEFIGLNTIYIYVFHFFAIHLIDFSFLQNWLLSINRSIFTDLAISIIPSLFIILFSLFLKKIIQNTQISKIIFFK